MEATRKPTVLQIVAVSFSGSSLLEALLDSQSQITALGEAHSEYNMNQDGFYCRLCDTHDRKACSFFRGFDKYERKANEFYGYCFSQSNAEALVDSSKSYTHYSLLQSNQYQYQAIFLSKTPHAVAYSSMHRHPGRDTFEEYTEKYLAHYRDNIDLYTYWDIPVRTITYRELVEDSRRIVRDLCRNCGISYEDFSPEHALCNQKSHIINGNISIIAQQTEQEDFCWEGKYQDRYGQLFLDEEWKKDPEFMREYLEIYRTRGKELEPILAYLGQPNVATLIAELEDQLIKVPTSIKASVHLEPLEQEHRWHISISN